MLPGGPARDETGRGASRLRRRAGRGPPTPFGTPRISARSIEAFDDRLLASFGRDLVLREPSVVDVQRPGSSFDRPYTRLQRAPGELPDECDEDSWLRVRIARAVHTHIERRLRTVAPPG
jgi:hypothetical protein